MHPCRAAQTDFFAQHTKNITMLFGGVVQQRVGARLAIAKLKIDMGTAVNAGNSPASACSSEIRRMRGVTASTCVTLNLGTQLSHAGWFF